MLERLRITQTFSQEYGIHNVNLTVYESEIVGVVVRSGSNRRGLFQLLTGKTMPSFGTLYLEGKEASIYGENIYKHGIGGLSKKTQLIPNLSIYENLFIISKGSYFRSLLPRHVYITETRRLLEEVGLGDIEPTAKGWSLSQSESHLIEIIKMIILGAKMLILDDVTSGYTEKELKRLCDFLLGKKQEGLSVLFLTNRYSTLFTMADQISIMRGGTTVKHETHMPLTPETLGAYLGDSEALVPLVSEKVGKDICFELRDFLTPEMNKALSFALGKGEVLGGLETDINRGTDIGKALYGLESYSGEAFIHRESIKIRESREALSHGLIYLEGSDTENSIFYNMGLISNLTILLGKEFDSPLGFTNRGIRYYKVEKAIEALDLFKLVERYPLYQPIRYATPIDRMRIQLARAYIAQPKVLLIANPHIGFGEMRLEDFRKLLKTFLDIDIGVVIFSTNRHNLEEVCHRIIEI